MWNNASLHRHIVFQSHNRSPGNPNHPYLLLFRLLLLFLPSTLLCSSLEFSLQLECSQLFLLLRCALRQAAELWNLLVTPCSCSFSSALLLLANDKGGQKPKAHRFEGLLQHARHKTQKTTLKEHITKPVCPACVVLWRNINILWSPLLLYRMLDSS